MPMSSESLFSLSQLTLTLAFRMDSWGLHTVGEGTFGGFHDSHGAPTDLLEKVLVLPCLKQSENGYFDSSQLAKGHL